MESGHVTYAQLTLPSPHRDGGHHHPFNQQHPRGKCGFKRQHKIYLHWVLGSCNFSGAVFTCVHFQKSSNMFGSCNFPYRNSFTHTHFLYTLVTNDFTLVDFVQVDFCQTQKCQSQGQGV